MKNLKKITLFLTIILMIVSCGVKQKEYFYDYIPVKLKSDDKKISLIDYDGNLILEDEFDATSTIIPTEDVITEFKRDGKVRYWQIVDKKLKPLVDMDYNGGTPFFEGVAIVRDEKGLLSLINTNGETLIPNLSNIGEYQIVVTGVMSDGLIRFKTSEGLWGYLNKSGEIKIKPTYTVSENFVNGYARVMTSDNSFSVIDKKGEIIFKGDEDITYYPISESYMSFKKKNGNEYLSGLIDFKSKEKIIKDSKYETINVPYNGYISVKNQDDEWGMLNSKGEIIGDLRFKYERAPVYSISGSIIAKEDKKIKIFNNKGELIKSFDDYTTIYPMGKKRLFAWRKNGKFDILDNDGKEVSKESYIFAGIFNVDRLYNEMFSTFEQTGIVKNYFSIKSKYFEFEKNYSSIFKNISTDDLASINSSTSIEQVLGKFPFKSYIGSTRSSSNSDDNYSLSFTVTLGKSTATQSSNNAPLVDTAAVVTNENNNVQPQKAIDNYPYLNTYSSQYKTYLTASNGINVTYTFNFDQNLKTEVLGKDPVFTEEETTVGYELNKAGKLISFSIDYSLGEIDTKIFYDNMVKKITEAGWIKDEAKNYFINSKNQNKLVLSNSQITIFYFN